jgi:signal peptidase I
MVGKAVFIWTSFEFANTSDDWLPSWFPSTVRIERIGKIGQ